MRQPATVHKTLSAGMLVVHFDGDRYRLLALRAFDSWDFPKAVVADGQDPLQAAVRQTAESTGLSGIELKWGEDFRETIAFADGRVSRYYLGESASDEVVLRVPAGEGALEDFEFRWVTAEEAEDILPPRLALILDWATERLAERG